MMDLPTADKEQLAAFIVCFFSLLFHRETSYCFCSGMSVYWLFGPPPSRRSSPLVMISRSASSSSCGDPAPRCPIPTPLQTLFLVIQPYPTRSCPILPRGTVLSSVSSLRPQILHSRIPPCSPVLLIPKRASWLQNKSPSEPGMVKNTPSMSTRTPRSLVPPCCMLVCTTAWLPDSACVRYFHQ